MRPQPIAAATVPILPSSIQALGNEIPEIEPEREVVKLGKFFWSEEFETYGDYY